MHGVEGAESDGIGNIAWGLSSAYYWNFVGLVGCVILIFGFIFSIINYRNK
jgi:hypothetical protein